MPVEGIKHFNLEDKSKAFTDWSLLQEAEVFVEIAEISDLASNTWNVSEKETPESMALAGQKILKNPAKFAEYRVNAWERAKTLHWDRIIPQACDWLEGQARSQGR